MRLQALLATFLSSPEAALAVAQVTLDLAQVMGSQPSEGADPALLRSAKDALAASVGCLKVRDRCKLGLSLPACRLVSLLSSALGHCTELNPRAWDLPLTLSRVLLCTDLPGALAICNDVVLSLQRSSNGWAVHSVAGCLNNESVQQTLHDLNASVSLGFPEPPYCHCFYSFRRGWIWFCRRATEPDSDRGSSDDLGFRPRALEGKRCAVFCHRTLRRFKSEPCLVVMVPSFGCAGCCRGDTTEAVGAEQWQRHGRPHVY